MPLPSALASWTAAASEARRRFEISLHAIQPVPILFHHVNRISQIVNANRGSDEHSGASESNDANLAFLP